MDGVGNSLLSSFFQFSLGPSSICRLDCLLTCAISQFRKVACLSASSQFEICRTCCPLPATSSRGRTLPSELYVIVILASYRGSRSLAMSQTSFLLLLPVNCLAEDEGGSESTPVDEKTRSRRKSDHGFAGDLLFAALLISSRCCSIVVRLLFDCFCSFASSASSHYCFPCSYLNLCSSVACNFPKLLGAVWGGHLLKIAMPLAFLFYYITLLPIQVTRLPCVRGDNGRSRRGSIFPSTATRRNSPKTATKKGLGVERKEQPRAAAVVSCSSLNTLGLTLCAHLFVHIFRRLIVMPHGQSSVLVWAQGLPGAPVCPPYEQHLNTS